MSDHPDGTIHRDLEYFLLKFKWEGKNHKDIWKVQKYKWKNI